MSEIRIKQSQKNNWHMYIVPVLAALLLHFGLLIFLQSGFEKHNPVLVKSEPIKIVQASLVRLEKSKPKPVVKKTVKPKPQNKPVIKKEKVEKKQPDQILKKQEPAIKKEKVEPVKPIEQPDDIDQLLDEEDRLLQQEVEISLVQSYISTMQADIISQWSRPPSARNNMQVTLKVRMVPTGEVIDVVVVTSSGNQALDRSALQAIKKVGRFAYLQDLSIDIFDRHFRELTFNFRPEDLRL